MASPKSMLIKKDIKEKRELVNIILDRFLPRKDEYPKIIHKAIRHTLFAGGKRIRPYLTLAVYSLFDDDFSKVKYLAGAVELMHTYSLIHDDLPEIDNDDMRRGKKACHILYGSDIALLAGDALLVSSFDLITASPFTSEEKIMYIKELAETGGHNGLISGQIQDISFEDKKVSKRMLDYIHDNKTGKLLNLSVKFGCMAANAPQEDMERLEKYATKIGLAFQIVDDILDVEGDPKILGKSVGKDADVKKATFPAVYGLEKSHEMAEKLIKSAKKILSHYGEKAEMLQLLTDFILTRKF
ncbi:MAG: geranylgeranyl pyrophosphate synthase [Candidatus Cloacimonetes bacterium 4572_65]|nr:MAG: geranylgeranyl pyrophosphate synthase [Candidatus Cloacimonetes bacterium 4572_65]